jgi:hypothetical protein
MRDRTADSSPLAGNGRTLALPHHLRANDLVNELAIVEESNTVRHEFLFLTIHRLDFRIL